VGYSTVNNKSKGATDEIRHEKEEKATRGFKKVYGSGLHPCV
jgi:hypothetical protein